MDRAIGEAERSRQYLGRMGSQREQSCRGDNVLVTMGMDAKDLKNFAGCGQGYYIGFELPSSQLAPKCVRVVAGLVAGSGLR